MQKFGRVAGGAGAAAVLLATMMTASGASAAVSGAVPFADATFQGYATGTEVHLGALTSGTTTLANVDQAFSGASTSTAGLTHLIRSETTNVVQPVQVGSVKAYGRGSGFELGLGTSTVAGKDPNQVILKGLAESTAPPNKPAVTQTIGPINLAPVLTASLLTGRAASIFDATQCPIGQPISYGMGDAANVNALTLTGAPTVNTAGAPSSNPRTTTARTDSYTILTPNSDGSFGLSSVASDIIAPITVNVLGQLQLLVSVHSAGNINDPVTLTAKATGGSTGASVKVGTDDLLTVDLVAGGTTTNLVTIDLKKVNPGGIHIPLSTGALGSTLTSIAGAAAGVAGQLPSPIGTTLDTVLSNPQLTGALQTLGTSVSQITNQVATLDLGYLDIDTTPHAIGGSIFTPPTVIGGKSAAGAMDLVHLNITPKLTAGGTTTTLPTIVDLRAGHLETSANLAASIDCGIPIIKSADPTSVKAGSPFVYNIQVPDPAKADLFACDLTNMTVTDVISDSTANPTFHVDSASNGGTVNQTDPTHATVTWTGLSWKVGSPPVQLSINLTVPQSSPSGTIKDIVSATGATNACHGGITGVENVGGISGTTLTGSFTLEQPSVTAAAAASAAPAVTLPAKLPFTGAMGGLWQPIAGLGVLGLGGGSLALVKRSRRRTLP